MELSDALDFIRDKRNGMLLTIKGDGRPQSSNIAYVVGDDDVIAAFTYQNIGFTVTAQVRPAADGKIALSALLEDKLRLPYGLAFYAHNGVGEIAFGDLQDLRDSGVFEAVGAVVLARLSGHVRILPRPASAHRQQGDLT